MKIKLVAILLFSVLASAQTADPFTAKIQKMSADIRSVSRELKRHAAVEAEFFVMTREIMALKDPETLEIMARHMTLIQEILNKP